MWRGGGFGAWGPAKGSDFESHPIRMWDIFRTSRPEPGPRSASTSPLRFNYGTASAHPGPLGQSEPGAESE